MCMAPLTPLPPLKTYRCGTIRVRLLMIVERQALPDFAVDQALQIGFGFKIEHEILT
jgi:hypothetical protein